MVANNPKRIAIIGLPGSGKSTFATRLGKLLNLPVHHLDRYQFEGKEKKDPLEFLLAKEALVNEKTWIIEGCSISTLAMRFARADRVIYFQFSRFLCIWRIFKRWLIADQVVADSGCLVGVNWLLVKYIWNFDKEKWQIIDKLRNQYPQVDFIVISSPAEAEAYLQTRNGNANIGKE